MTSDLGLALLVSAILILATLGMRLKPLVRDGYENSWLVLGAGGLALVAFTVPNRWIGLLAIGLAINPIVCWIGVKSGLLVRDVLVPAAANVVARVEANVTAPPDARLAQQLTAMAGLGLYALLVGHVHGLNMPWIAAVLVLWGVVNVGMLVWRYAGWRDPFHCPDWAHNMGFTGMGPSLAWLLSVGALSCLYLAAAWSPWWLLGLIPQAYGLLKTQNYSAPAAICAGCLLFGWIVWPQLRPLAPSLVLAPLAMTWVAVRRKDSHTARWQDMKRSLELLRITKGLGAGLGFVKTTERRRIQGSPIPEHAYTCLHCEWVQALVEVGPLPVIAALGYLIATAVWLPATPFHAYAFGLIVANAVYAIVYFPLRVPWQALLILVAMAALEAR